MILKDKLNVCMINATKETYHLLTRILTVVSHSELAVSSKDVTMIWATCSPFVAIFLEVHTIRG